MESSDNLRSELYTTFFSGMEWAKTCDTLKFEKFLEVYFLENFGDRTILSETKKQHIFRSNLFIKEKQNYMEIENF